MLIQVENSLDKSAQFSYLSTSISVGASTIPVQNINSFTALSGMQIGISGEERSEIILSNSGTPSGTSIISSGTTRFDHPQDTPIYNIKYNQVVFERSTSGTSGTATPMTNGTVLITPDSLYTQFEDTSGASTYAYRSYFRNSVTGEITQESDWITSSGFSFYSLSNMRNRVRTALFNADYIKDDAVIDSWINEWQENMNNSAIKVNQDYSIGTVAIGFGTSGLGTVTNSDFKMARKMEVSYNGGVDWVNSRQIPINQFSNTDIFTSVYPSHYWEGDNVFGIRPARSGGSVKVTYQKILAPLVDDTDELTPIFRNYTSGCVNYCLMRAYYNDQKIDYARDHRALFEKSKVDFISEITPRDQTGPHTIQFDDTLSGRADDFDLEYYTW